VPDTRVTVFDVGPRDGLQNEPDILAPGVRAELVDRLVRAGIRAVEVASFVDPRRVPQMAGAEDVVAAIERVDRVVQRVRTEREGLRRLAACGLDEVGFAFGATESFNRRNQNASVEESLAAGERIVARAKEDGIVATVTISVAFGCPFEDRWIDGCWSSRGVAASGRPDRPRGHDRGRRARHVHSLTARTAALAIRWADTSTTRGAPGTRTPSPRSRPERPCSTPVGGLGGCPFAPKATGNIATGPVYLLHGEGVETDRPRFPDRVAGLRSSGRRLGQVYRAGASSA
jgi:hypothetical protein